MKMQSELSDVTKRYLSCFYKILDDMIVGMTNAELTDSISHNFIVQMIPHHMAAIEMSENILKYTTFLPLQNIAKNIICEQTKSIENMTEILPSCSCKKNGVQELCLYQEEVQKIEKSMFCRMRRAYTVNNINSDFIREMIPHHEGAVALCETTLRFSICPELVPILKAIIRSQTKGVYEMQHLLR